VATTPRGMTVTEAYRSYREGQFIVNRTYQRKLVWTHHEKVRLLDSMLRRYPIPLILLLQTEQNKYEIIDGMQRLNAIFSFIENTYPLADGRFFNVDEFATAKEVASQGLFEPAATDQKLSRAECATVLDYQLAVTIFTVGDESDVTDVFGRINSGGKQLSPQEQRQAGVVTPFASFIRRLSSELRGDASAEMVNLADMPLVSVDAPTLKLGYGIHAEDTFWCKQGVLRTKELRDGYDEQTVADLAASVLLDEPFGVSRERLDEAYDIGSDLHTGLHNRLAAYPADQLGQELKSTFSVLTETIESVDPLPNAFRRRVNPQAGGNPVRTPFYAVFMAFFKLVIRDSKEPTDAAGILAVLENLASKLETGSHHVKSSDRRANIDVTVGLIQDRFAHRELPLLNHGPGLALDFENALRRSKIETPRYEFKQGVLDLSRNRVKNGELAARLAEIACSIANISPGTDGFIYIGVADDQEDAQRVAQIDSVAPIKVGDVHVVGIDREAKRNGQTIEEYVRALVADLRATDLSEPLKTDLLAAVDTVLYRGFSVVRLRIRGQSRMSWVGDESFVREGSETHLATAKQVAAVTARFSGGANNRVHHICQTAPLAWHAKTMTQYVIGNADVSFGSFADPYPLQFQNPAHK
jgi:hypothetical protein